MKTLLNYLHLLVILPVFLILLAFSGGSPGGRTGSPGDNSNNCTGCHTGSPQQVSEWITTDIPQGGYLEDQTYTITLTATDANAQKFGFELTVEDVNGNKTGLLSITNSTETKLVNNNNAVTHTAEGNTPENNTKVWSTEWTAPEESTGDVFFYAAVNAADGDGTSSGDLIYLTNAAISPNLTTTKTNKKNVFSLFPNPSTGIINISMTEICQKSEIVIYNSFGQKIMKLRPENEITTIDFSGLAKGMYFVRTSEAVSEKLIIY